MGYHCFGWGGRLVAGSWGTLVEAGSAGSFGIEVFALDELVGSLFTLCRNQGVNDGSWKVVSAQYSRSELLEVKRI